MPNTYLEGAQHTLAINQDRRFDAPIHPDIYYLEEDLTPLVVLTWGKGKEGLPIKKTQVSDPEFKILSKLPHEMWTAINYSTGYTAGATTITVDTTAHLVPGLLLKTVSTAEVLYVDSVDSATVLTVVRSVGETAAGSLANNEPLLVIGSVNAENASPPDFRRVKSRTISNYTQIFREVIAASRTLENTKLVGGKSRTDLRKEAWLTYRTRLEAAYLWGEPFESEVLDADGNPVRGTAGIAYYLTQYSRVGSVTTTLTKTEWATFSRNLFRYGKKRKVVLCAPLIIDFLNDCKDGKLEMRASDEFYNLRVAEWTTGHGTMVIIKDELLQDSTYGTGGYGGVAIGLEPEQLEYVYLENSDSHLRANVHNPGTDGWKDEILGEVGLAYKLPETGYMIKGVEEYSVS